MILQKATPSALALDKTPHERNSTTPLCGSQAVLPILSRSPRWSTITNRDQVVRLSKDDILAINAADDAVVRSTPLDARSNWLVGYGAKESRGEYLGWFQAGLGYVDCVDYKAHDWNSWHRWENFKGSVHTPRATAPLYLDGEEFLREGGWPVLGDSRDMCDWWE